MNHHRTIYAKLYNTIRIIIRKREERLLPLPDANCVSANNKTNRGWSGFITTTRSVGVGSGGPFRQKEVTIVVSLLKGGLWGWVEEE